MADAILTVKHLNKSYGHQPVLRDVSFECTQGTDRGPGGREWRWKNDNYESNFRAT